MADDKQNYPWNHRKKDETKAFEGVYAGPAAFAPPQQMFMAVYAGPQMYNPSSAPNGQPGAFAPPPAATASADRTASADQKYCPSCGMPIPKTFKFCSECGAAQPGM